MKCFCCDFIAEFKKGFVYWRKVLSSFFQLLYAISLFRLFINENSCSRNANAMYGVFSCQLSLRPSSHEIWTCLDNKATPLIRPIFFLTHWWSFQRGSLYHYHCTLPLALTTVFTPTNTTTASFITSTPDHHYHHHWLHLHYNGKAYIHYHKGENGKIKTRVVLKSKKLW